MSRCHTFVSVVCLVFAAVIVAGCATTGVGSPPAEEVVLERAQARLNAMLARDWAAAYPFMTPGYRAIVPQRRFGNQFQGPVQWEEAKAKDAKCEEKRCVVNVEVSFRLVLPGHMDRITSTNFEEIWVLEDGQWFKFEPM